MPDTAFAASYGEARRRFKGAAAAAGARVTSHIIDAPAGDAGEDDLAIDVAAIGPAAAPTVVLSSGIHGVEGFLGSAVQCAVLDQLRDEARGPDLRYVLIHAVNPYGFARLRRFNEDNVDLNRNFLDDPAAFAGAPEGYAGLLGFLNPPSPPPAFELFGLKAAAQILRHGMPSLQRAIASGQYEYPQGIFYGGSAPCQSTRVVFEHCDDWAGSGDVLHIDFHTGLGPFGAYELQLTAPADAAALRWYTGAFGAGHVKPLSAWYPARGLFGAWLQAHFKGRSYRFLGAEFGTYGVVRVLRALRAENRAHHYGDPASQAYRAAKAELLECFCPSDAAWRRQVLEGGLSIVAQAAAALRNRA